MKKIITFATIIIVVVLLILFFNKLQSKTYNVLNYSKSHEIILTEAGFSPEKLTIKNGDSVVFKTNRNKPFWPASNLHPTHEIYPEFDPKEPVEPQKTWSFQFNKIGTWKYHDHLSPYYAGTLQVVK